MIDVLHYKWIIKIGVQCGNEQISWDIQVFAKWHASCVEDFSLTSKIFYIQVYAQTSIQQRNIERFERFIEILFLEGKTQLPPSGKVIYGYDSLYKY
jgi:ATP/ADP translocase